MQPHAVGFVFLMIMKNARKNIRYQRKARKCSEVVTNTLDFVTIIQTNTPDFVT